MPAFCEFPWENITELNYKYKQSPDKAFTTSQWACCSHLAKLSVDTSQYRYTSSRDYIISCRNTNCPLAPASARLSAQTDTVLCCSELSEANSPVPEDAFKRGRHPSRAVCVRNGSLALCNSSFGQQLCAFLSNWGRRQQRQVSEVL